MNFFYWLHLFGFVSLLTLSGLFINSHFFDDDIDFLCHQAGAKITKPHPFLCKQKVELKNAKISELALVHGISYKRARKINAFLKDNPKATLKDLIKIRGIGPKLLSKLRQYFI